MRNLRQPKPRRLIFVSPPQASAATGPSALAPAAPPRSAALSTPHPHSHHAPAHPAPLIQRKLLLPNPATSPQLPSPRTTAVPTAATSHHCRPTKSIASESVPPSP